MCVFIFSSKSLQLLRCLLKCVLRDDQGMILSYFSYLGVCILFYEKGKNHNLHSAKFHLILKNMNNVKPNASYWLFQTCIAVSCFNWNSRLIKTGVFSMLSFGITQVQITFLEILTLIPLPSEIRSFVFFDVTLKQLSRINLDIGQTGYGCFRREKTTIARSHQIPDRSRYPLPWCLFLFKVKF